MNAAPIWTQTLHENRWHMIAAHPSDRPRNPNNFANNETAVRRSIPIWSNEAPRVSGSMCSFRTTAEIRQPHPLWPPSLCGCKRSIFCSTAQMIYSCPRRPQHRTSVASNICRAVKRIEMNLLRVLRLILTRPALSADTPFADLLLLQYQKFVVHYVTVRCFDSIKWKKEKHFVVTIIYCEQHFKFMRKLSSALFLWTLTQITTEWNKHISHLVHCSQAVYLRWQSIGQLSGPINRSTSIS